MEVKNDSVYEYIKSEGTVTIGKIVKHFTEQGVNRNTINGRLQYLKTKGLIRQPERGKYEVWASSATKGEFITELERLLNKRTNSTSFKRFSEFSKKEQDEFREMNDALKELIDRFSK